MREAENNNVLFSVEITVLIVFIVLAVVKYKQFSRIDELPDRTYQVESKLISVPVDIKDKF